MHHPIQPIEKDSNGIVRFRGNSIVAFLAKDRLNELARMEFPDEDWEQLAQLIGYSLSGFGDLCYVHADTLTAAHKMADHPGMTEEQARIAALEATLKEAREHVRDAACTLFSKAPEDFHG